MGLRKRKETADEFHQWMKRLESPPAYRLRRQVGRLLIADGRVKRGDGEATVEPLSLRALRGLRV
jgi:hypothetical protein